MPVEPITWEEFQSAIAPMWNVEDPTTIPIINNPFRVISYPLADWLERIVHVPFRYTEDGVTVGYTTFYNVDDRTVRTRGVYVLPEHRERGVGHRMLKAGMGLFPGFDRLVGFFREANVERFIRHSEMAVVPGTDWFWSDYSQIRLRMLYRQFDRPVCLAANRKGCDHHVSQYGLAGTNNLGRSFTPDEWLAYAEPHAWTYPDGKINLDF